MRPARIAHGPRLRAGQAARVPQHQRRQQGRPPRLQPPRERRFRRQPRGLRGVVRAPNGGGRGARQMNLLGPQHPRGPVGAHSRVLIVVSRIPRAARRPQASENLQTATGRELRRNRAPRQPKLGARRPGSRRELEQSAPTLPRAARGPDQPPGQPPRDARHSLKSPRRPPGPVGRGRADDRRPQQDPTQKHALIRADLPFCSAESLNRPSHARHSSASVGSR